MIYKLTYFIFACGLATIPALAFGSMATLVNLDAGVFTGIFVYVSLVHTLIIKMPDAKK